MSTRSHHSTGFTTGKPYAMEAPNGRPFVTDQYAKMAHGNAIRDFPFIACSDSPFTEVRLALLSARSATNPNLG